MAARDVWAIVRCGTLEELRQALPSDETRRKAAVCVFHPGWGTSLLTKACGWGRWDMAAALVQEHGHPVDLADPKFGSTALLQMCAWGRTEAALFLIRTLGANPHAVDKKGYTALHFACNRQWAHGAGAHPGARLPTQCQRGQPRGQHAAAEGQP